jgi:putative acetyltransferase
MSRQRISYRVANEDDVEGIRKATRSAIEGIASRDYPKEVTDKWGTTSPKSVLKHKEAIREGRELTWVAEVDGLIIGFSALCPGREELRAVYISSDYERQGVGTQLLQLLEQKAEELQLPKLEMHSSTTAKPFYESHGYENLGEGTHTLSSGVSMQCYFMRKILIKKVLAKKV